MSPVSTELYSYQPSKVQEESEYPQISSFSNVNIRLFLKTGKDILLCASGVSREKFSKEDKESLLIERLTDQSTAYALASLRSQVELFYVDHLAVQREFRLTTQSSCYKSLSKQSIEYLSSSSVESDISIEFLFSLYLPSDCVIQLLKKSSISDDSSTIVPQDEPNVRLSIDSPVYQPEESDELLQEVVEDCFAEPKLTENDCVPPCEEGIVDQSIQTDQMEDSAQRKFEIERSVVGEIKFYANMGRMKSDVSIDFSLNESNVII